MKNKIANIIANISKIDENIIKEKIETPPEKKM